MKQATLYRYALPMDSGVILRHTRLALRDGFIVELRVDDRIGRGEVAPLPEFSAESIEQAGKELEVCLADWLNDRDIDWNNLSPSVAFGLSVAIAELNQDIPGEGNYLSAPLCSGDPDELVEKLAALPGEKVAKIKVGLYEPIRDGMVANMFLEVIPDLRLRLDANRQWTPTKAAQFAKYVNPAFRKRIAFLEEPCQTPEQSLDFAAETGIAIAWDETVREDGFEVKKQQGVSAIVIKPTLVGSLQTVQKLADEAKAKGLEVVISSSIESSFGLNQLARIANWLTPDTLPGLDTISLFKAQLETAWPGCELPLTTLKACDVVWQAQC